MKLISVLFFSIKDKTVTCTSLGATCIFCSVTPNLDSVADADAVLDIDTETIFYIGVHGPSGRIDIVAKAKFMTPSVSIGFE